MKRLLSILLVFGAGVCEASSPTYQQTVLADNPFAYWRLDEASGNLVDSILGESCNPSGTIAYSQTGALLDGSANPAIKPNGSTGYCQTPAPVIGGFFPQHQLDQGWSLEVWFKPASLAASGYIVSVGSGTRYAWSLVYGTDGKVYFHVYGGGTSGDACQDDDHALIGTTAGVLTVGTYTHIVVTLVGKGFYTCGGDTCQGVKDVKIYINGALNNDTATYNYTNLEHTECVRNDLTFQIARLEFAPTELANGTIDELSLYNAGSAASALSARQVFCHYEAGIGTPCGAERRRVYQMQ